MPIVLKSGSLNFLELSGPVQACTGIALPFILKDECKPFAMLIVPVQNNVVTSTDQTERSTRVHVILQTSTRVAPTGGGLLLTPWSRVLLEKLTGSAASQEIPRIFGTRKFITVLTSARHLSLS